jgi:hypothetical protein
MAEGRTAHDVARSIAVVGVAIALAACSTLSRNAVPESTDLSEVLAVAPSAPVLIRIWGDTVPKDMTALARPRDARYRTAGTILPV